MLYQIQSFVLPTESKHRMCRKLFYRGDNGFIDVEKSLLCMDKYARCDFVTYLNACSYEKWKRYTGCGLLHVYLELEGKFEIVYVGYRKENEAIIRDEYDRIRYVTDGRETIEYCYPENTNQMVGIEINSMDETVFYGGSFSVEIEEGNLNEIKLSISTTTCFKEAYIKKNVALIKNDILNRDDEVGNNIFLHVVDNGRTLSEEDICGKHVYLHPNKNVGGAGGFARGMLESMYQEPKASHVVLMDDDVLILPESIIRTYKLLRLMKEEYKDYFIGGAMLYYETPFKQHEDIGSVVDSGIFQAIKPKFDHGYLYDNLSNEGKFLKRSSQYQAWWYCCIPISMIERNGLPLPVFIRGDDIEYSLRCNASIITMNGICLWHMGFGNKYMNSIDVYQQMRNILIAKAGSEILQNVNMLHFARISFQRELLKFNYYGAEIIILALEHFLNGPNFLREKDGFDILKQNAQYNEIFKPIEEFNINTDRNIWDCFCDKPRRFLDTWMRRITYNGHRFTLPFMERLKTPLVGFDNSYQAQKITMCKQCLAVNPYAQTAVLRVKDKKKYKQLRKKFMSTITYIEKNKRYIDDMYREGKKELTSVEFWRKYLGI